MFLFFYIGHGGLTSTNKQVLLGTDESVEKALDVEDMLNHLMRMKEPI